MEASRVTSPRVPVAVLGATGYAGVELLRLLARHPAVELAYLSSEQYRDRPAAEVYPFLEGIVSGVLCAPDPAAVARRLPRGTDVVYRHFGVAERVRVARKLMAIARGRGLVLLIAADPALAQRVGAHGVHWPQRLAPQPRGCGVVRR